MASFVVSSEGELRAALAKASGQDQPHTIVLAPDFGTVELSDTPLVYSGTTPLRIHGNGATLSQGNSATDILISEAGANLSIRNLSFEGGYRAIWTPLPADATGTTTVDLNNVKVSGTFFHGVHVDDQINNSDASVVLKLTNSTIDSNGRVGSFGTPGSSLSDADGVRVDEGGAGSGTVIIRSSAITGNGADGVELDETGDGDASLVISRSIFEKNGIWDPDDLDDGVDVDETGLGDITTRISNSRINDNFDEGLDLDEAGGGRVLLQLSNTEISGNGDEGLKVTEEDGGDIITGLRHLRAGGNGDDGIQLEQFGGGRVALRGLSIHTFNNGNDGLRLDSLASADGDPVLYAPMEVVLNRFTSSGNSGDGLDLRGSGFARLRRSTFTGNGDDIPQLTGGSDLFLFG
ncbi:right-handed parallel beta-helix repeat-containing protein [Cyanobium sp. NIES-981]|uniref:right-handed parallel beta-helix repeat-containing protein n=1 Tax=Cyanobium sp. NIES-981 TaxID=1851505 RepID=UPI0007DD8ECE|nr:right-handed parallel beta-helix repeat-containing protein [Cyanobium sp. NIES-981]SBO43050.1 conserved protein of unknown function [Cyanobium sp. NIES-981]